MKYPKYGWMEYLIIAACLIVYLVIMGAVLK